LSRMSLNHENLIFRDGNQNTRAVLGQAELTDKAGSTIIRPPSSLVLFDETGHMKWSAP